MLSNKSESEYRQAIKELMESIFLPMDWRVSMVLDEGSVKIVFKKRLVKFLKLYFTVREITEYDYEGLFMKISKHPKLLQTEDMVCGSSDEIRPVINYEVFKLAE